MASPTPTRAPAFEYDTISGFPLLWRWTQATHDVLTPDELANIRPLSRASAAVALRYAESLRELAEKTSPLEFELRDENEGDLEAWMDRLPVGLDERVVLSWDRDVAAETPWSGFLRRWSAFWYPASDDLDVLPATGNWFLQLRHGGRFTFSSLGVREPDGEPRADRRGQPTPGPAAAG